MPDIYLHSQGQQTGPYQPEQVRQLLVEGKISGETLAWYQGLDGWSAVKLVLPSIPSGQPVPPPPPPKKKGMHGCLIAAIIIGVIGICVLPCLAGIALGPINQGIKKAKENIALQHARQIELCLFSYATDHNGAYPTGGTSTEIFQKLIDEKYITDPTVFFIAMPGKTQAINDKLSAENVCFDVTGGVTSDSSSGLPLVFCTGYQVIYAAGASAGRDQASIVPFSDGLVVAYKDNSARFLKADPQGDVPGFIPSSFDPGSQTYHQLKP